MVLLILDGQPMVKQILLMLIHISSSSFTLPTLLIISKFLPSDIATPAESYPLYSRAYYNKEYIHLIFFYSGGIYLCVESQVI